MATNLLARLGALLLTISVVLCVPVQEDKRLLRFKVSGRSLGSRDQFGRTSDTYVEIYYTETGTPKHKLLTRSSTIRANENPDWNNVFEFEFDRSKAQKWYFKVYNSQGYTARGDDDLGQAIIDVADYVDKGQYVNTNLHKQGYLTVRQASGRGGVPALAYTSGPNNLTLQFKLSASELVNKGHLGTTDPFVDVFFTRGPGGDHIQFGRTTATSNNANPVWGDTFDFAFDRKQDQRWLFRVYDVDGTKEEDVIGTGWVEVNDFVAHGQIMTLDLVPSGTLTITRTDGQPAIPPGSKKIPNTPLHHGTEDELKPNLSDSEEEELIPVKPRPKGPIAGDLDFVWHETSIPTAKLIFRLSAANLEDRDLIGTSDPYVQIFYKETGGRETHVKSTRIMENDENPDWPDILEIYYDKRRDPKLRLLILDEDNSKADDELGSAIVDINEYIANNEVQTFKLGKGTITMKKAYTI